MQLHLRPNTIRQIVEVHKVTMCYYTALKNFTETHPDARLERTVFVRLENNIRDLNKNTGLDDEPRTEETDIRGLEDKLKSLMSALEKTLLEDRENIKKTHERFKFLTFFVGDYERYTARLISALCEISNTIDYHQSGQNRPS